MAFMEDVWCVCIHTMAFMPDVCVPPVCMYACMSMHARCLCVWYVCMHRRACQMSVEARGQFLEWVLSFQISEGSEDGPHHEARILHCQEANILTY